MFAILQAIHGSLETHRLCSLPVVLCILNPSIVYDVFMVLELCWAFKCSDIIFIQPVFFITHQFLCYFLNSGMEYAPSISDTILVYDMGAYVRLIMMTDWSKIVDVEAGLRAREAVCLFRGEVPS